MKKIFILSILVLILLPNVVFADADINDDDSVDVYDLILVSQNFGRTAGFTDSEVDTDNNGVVDIFDLVYVASRFGTAPSASVAYWSFNGSALDSWGNNNCTLYGNPVFETGASGQGLVLDGVDDYASCGNDASLEMATGDLTIAAWIKLLPVQPTWVGIVEKGATAPATKGYWLSYYKTKGDLRFYVSNGTNREYLDSDDNLGLNDSVWHHIAVVYDRDDKAYFYVNGTGVGSYPTSFNESDITNPNINFKISYSAYFNGSIDEVKIFRKALTQQEILNIMGAPPQPPIQCTGTCKPNNCSSYDDCAVALGNCSSGYCCSGNCTTGVEGNEIYAASLSPDDIQAAADTASDGDTIILPAGDYYGFDETVYVKNGVSMRGQGRNATRIHASSAFTGDMFIWNDELQQANNNVKISGFSLYGSGAGKDSDTGRYIGLLLNDAHQMLDFIIYNFHGEGFSRAAILIMGVKYNSRETQTRIMRGLIYNSSFKEIYSDPPGVGYGVSLQGDNWYESEADEQPLGSADYVFVEDCTFDHCRHGFASGQASLQVVRHCTFTHPYTQPNTGYVQHLLDAHGTRGGDKSTQAYEYYHNVLDGTGVSGITKGIGLRGGHGVVWGNTFIDTTQWIRLAADETTEDSDLYFVHDLYIWDNIVAGSPQPIDVGYNVYPEYVKKNEDYFMYELAGYEPYPYPHPLRG